MSSPLVSRSSSLSWSSAQATRSVCASTSPLLRRSISSTSSGTSFTCSASSTSSRESVAAIGDRASNPDESINRALLVTSPIPPPSIEAPVNLHKTCRPHRIFPPGQRGCNGAGCPALWAVARRQPRPCAVRLDVPADSNPRYDGAQSAALTAYAAKPEATSRGEGAGRHPSLGPAQDSRRKNGFLSLQIGRGPGKPPVAP